MQRHEHDRVHISFEDLSDKIEKEYLKKGYSKEEAHTFAVETAAKIYRMHHVINSHPQHPIY